MVDTIQLSDIWAWLDEVPDPEIPAISVVDLGIVRDIKMVEGLVEVVVTPTYSGCPATRVISDDIETALRANGLTNLRIPKRSRPLDNGLDDGQSPRPPRGLRHCPTRGARAAQTLSTLPVSGRRKDQPVRLDTMQGTMAMPRLP